jgi:glutamyl-tRNA synthetase
MPRVRFAPSPTGYLHIGSARTFIFNWLYARHNNGTMILRLDDTDLERNTQTSIDSIFDGLRWLGLNWDEYYRQSERLALHQEMANRLLAAGHAYRDFTPAQTIEDDSGPWLFNPGMPELSSEESDRRAAAGEPFVLRFRVPRGVNKAVKFKDSVYGDQYKKADDIEDFALLRSNGMPTYHMASCADDVDLQIDHIIRGQDHLTNTFKHVLIFEALGGVRPKFAHLPLLIAPDGAKLSKRKHGPVVSVTTYRDAGFLPHAYINFLCLLGWSPKNNREQLSLPELLAAFSFSGVNRSNAVINFSDADPIDPKATWLNGQHIRSMPLEELLPFVRTRLEQEPGLTIDEATLPFIVDTIRARYTSLHDFALRGRPYFADDFTFEPAAIEKLDEPGTRDLLRALGVRLAADPEFTEASVEKVLRDLASEQDVKPGILINGSRAALTGQTVGPSAFHVFTAVGRARSLARLAKV